MVKSFRAHCAQFTVLLLVALSLAVPTLPADDGQQAANFFRGYNLNGPAIQIDGNAWESGNSNSVSVNGNKFENQRVQLKPSTDRRRAEMLRSSCWGGTLDLVVSDIPKGNYQVVAYVWEDNQRAEYQVLLNDVQMIERHSSGPAGSWQRLGPWPVNLAEDSGQIKLSARGGDANFSGVEIWSGRGPIPPPPPLDFNLAPSAEELAFFEQRIRPLLIEHCYDCHSIDSGEIAGGLLLDSQTGLLAGGSLGRPIVPRDPEASLLVQAIQHSDSLKMPPDSRLSDQQIDDLVQWVNQGAPDPRSDDTTAKMRQRQAEMLASAADFWSLKPVKYNSVPALAANHPLVNWPSGDIDRWVLNKMLSADLNPAPPSDRKTLIRRAAFDLTGLPPTPAEIEQFVNDPAPDAFNKVVERLLESPLYGQRWGRHWLDVVRYADTAGDNSDFPIPQMYKFRNWVIDAFNADLPYDEFVSYQLAGDLLRSDDPVESIQRQTATGYIANSRRFGSRVDDYPQHLTIEDTLDNLGRTFLATTINCARCHDHKFDPITTEDYYALYGIFHSTRYPWPGIELDQQQRDLVAAEKSEVVAQRDQQRNQEQQLLDKRVKELTEQRKQSKADESQRKQLDKEIEEAKAAAERLRKSAPAYEELYAVTEAKSIEDVQVQIKGNRAKPGRLVKRRFLSVLGGQELPPQDSSSGRLALAQWITATDNPLTYRVIVNRIWQWHFGQGMVATPSDFGRQGIPPTHPELLDYLTQAFVENGMSIKWLHRQIMLSATYQQSSNRSLNSLQLDPANQFLSGFPKRRLEAEAIRDTLMSLAGTLDKSFAGPHPFPGQESWKFTQHNPFKATYDTPYRSVYLMTQRIQRHPFLAIFDGADPSTSTGRRMTSTTPVQSLYFLNDARVHEWAKLFAAKCIASNAEPRQRLDYLFKHALGREPLPTELDELMEFASAYSIALRSSSSSAEVADAAANSTADHALELETWSAIARVVFRLNEFVYVD